MIDDFAAHATLLVAKGGYNLHRRSTELEKQHCYLLIPFAFSCSLLFSILFLFISFLFSGFAILF